MFLSIKALICIIILMEENMKKFYLVLFTIVLFLSGCSTNTNTPTSKIEEFMSKYQRMDSEVLSQLDSIVSNNKDLTDDQKKDYKNLIERQYQNISYKIKDENTSGENATVTVEVETFDYRSALNKSEEYYENNKKKFQKDDGKIDQEKYWDYKISEMKKTEDKIKNEIIFTLHKENDKWILDDISDSDRQQLHGLSGG